MARKRRTRKRRSRRRRRGGAEWGTGKEAYMSPAQTKASQDRFKKARALFSGKSTASPKNLYPTGSYLNRKSPTSVTKATVGPSALRMGIGSKAADASAKRFAERRAKFQKFQTRKHFFLYFDPMFCKCSAFISKFFNGNLIFVITFFS